MAFSIPGRSILRSSRYPTSGTTTSQTRKLLNFCEVTDLLFYTLSEFVQVNSGKTDEVLYIYILLKVRSNRIFIVRR
jgi:hypothetical protein